MKDEIKEILEDLEKIAKCEYYPEDLLYYENCQKLLDYITNLQEENEKLKEYQESYRKELDYWRIQFSNKKERIEKAIEYAKEHYVIDEPIKFKNDLLNILQGEDKDE